MKITMTEKKLDSLIKQLLRAVIQLAKTSGYDKPDFTCLVHDVWGDEED